MKLLNCIIFASLALGANLVHADAPCTSLPPGNWTQEREARILKGGTATSTNPTPASAGSSR